MPRKTIRNLCLNNDGRAAVRYKRFCSECVAKGFKRSGNVPYVEGERRRDGNGYIRIRVNGVVVPEHKYVMEQKIGRTLLSGVESVHHINGVRSDNRPDNLELWVGGIRYGQRATQIVCPHCGTPYQK